MELGDPVLVVERHRGAVLDGVAEVVDADVVAELLPGRLLLPRDQRGAGEAHHRGVGQRHPHVEREGVVLAAVRFVGDDDDVRAVRQHRHRLLALGRLELLDQREHIAVVGCQQLAQIRDRLGMHPRLGRDRAGVGELPVQLVVELLAVGDHHERPLARHLAQHLLGEPQHRQRLARPLGVPEDAEPLVLLGASPVQVVDRGVDAEVLVRPGQDLDQPTGALHERHEVLEQVEQHPRFAGAAQRGLQLDPAPLAGGVDDLPVAEELPRRVRRPDSRLAAVGQQHQAVGDEQLRDRVAVVGEVVVVGRLDRLVGLLELHQHQRHPVDEQRDVQPAAVQVALHPHLLHGQQVVVGGVAQIEVAQRLDALVTLLVGPLGPVSVSQQVVDLTVGADPVHDRAVLGDRLDRLVDDQVRNVGGVELAHREPEPMREYDVVLAVAAQGALRAQGLVERVDRSPAELFEQRHARLLDVVVLRPPRHHHATPTPAVELDETRPSRSSVDTSIWPVTSFGSSVTQSDETVPRQFQRRHHRPQRAERICEVALKLHRRAQDVKGLQAVGRDLPPSRGLRTPPFAGSFVEPRVITLSASIHGIDTWRGLQRLDSPDRMPGARLRCLHGILARLMPRDYKQSGVALRRLIVPLAAPNSVSIRSERSRSIEVNVPLVIQATITIADSRRPSSSSVPS